MYSYSNLASIDSILWNMQRLRSPIASVCTRAGGSFLLPTIAGWAYQWRCIVQKRYKQVYKSKTWFLFCHVDPFWSYHQPFFFPTLRVRSGLKPQVHYRHSQLYQFRQLESICKLKIWKCRTLLAKQLTCEAYSTNFNPCCLSAAWLFWLECM